MAGFVQPERGPGGLSLARPLCPYLERARRIQRAFPGTRIPNSGTQNPNSETRNPHATDPACVSRSPNPESRIPEPGTRIPNPGTRNPRLGTRNPLPKTRNTKREILFSQPPYGLHHFTTGFLSTLLTRCWLAGRKQLELLSSCSLQKCLKRRPESGHAWLICFSSPDSPPPKSICFRHTNRMLARAGPLCLHLEPYPSRDSGRA